jgi:hypothetical protein
MVSFESIVHKLDLGHQRQAPGHQDEIVVVLLDEAAVYPEMDPLRARLHHLDL